MLRNIKISFAAVLLLAMGCTRKWEDHDAKAVYVDNNLFQQVTANAELSTFAGYLKQTGYADTLSLSKNFTVWAPTNNALKNLDTAIVNNAANLKQFVAHHIATQSWFIASVRDSAKRVALLDGKYAWFSPDAFENATITLFDRVAANGVLHAITASAAPVGNCWNYIDSLSRQGNIMAAYLFTKTFKVRDLTNAVQVGVNPETGEAIYKEGTDSVILNRFTNSVYDVNKEEKEYTVFVLANTPFGTETDRLAPFNTATTADSTKDLSQWCVVKDLAVEGAYAPDQLPDSITAKTGVRVAVNKSAIVATYHTSNGYVYVMNEMAVSLTSKIPEQIIQGESYLGVGGGAASMFIRQQYDSLNGGKFTDLFAYKPNVNKFNVIYRAPEIYTTTYKVYWRAVNSTTLLANPYNQKLAMDSANSATFAYTAITPNNYNEVYLGEYKRTQYRNGMVYMFLVSADVTITSTTLNALLLDYIRLVPVR
ncbi:Uncaracterized surface protein containing fasciclin (FAS1) repeats [Filimonas lacunae]|uniref:Uncaracterized surface protein containing fasciclin (FAS1) repeats n=1 Tax=Filimonas lacunae TaxID=477680 RepID=A0A173MAM7_9BACT|nr:fasciclin domain-containing protein [Filimonas lacunae]BAV04518.1 hypothetical protein FLA_0510 [Filimonas lacunae]SIT31664.1 Uncaracterized surface protein containing fasciclin (FAS1) repeats [Filimonas lacunae]